MKKKRFAALLAAAALVGCLGAACLLESRAPDVLLAPETARDIFSRYEEELQYIAETCGVTVTAFTEETNDLLRQAAIDQYGTDRFAGLSRLVTELTIAWKNQEVDLPPDNTGAQQKTAYEAAADFGPITGTMWDAVPMGVTVEKTVKKSIGISLPEPIEELLHSDEWGTSTEFSRTLSGPKDGSELSDGKVATHNFGVDVQFGVIARRTDTAYDIWTGTWRENSEEVVCNETWEFFTLLGLLSTPVYIERMSDGVTVRCDNLLVFQEKLAEDPGQFL